MPSMMQSASAASWRALLPTTGQTPPPGYAPEFNSIYGYVGTASDYWAPLAPGLEWTSEWTASSIYVANQLARRNGNFYIALQSGYNRPPESSPTFWALFAARGDVDSAGAPGAIGPAGPAGPQGLTGAVGAIDRKAQRVS